MSCNCDQMSAGYFSCEYCRLKEKDERTLFERIEEMHARIENMQASIDLIVKQNLGN